MRLVALGIVIGMLAQLASMALGDNHSAGRTAGLSWYRALVRLRPDPEDAVYGLPAGLLLGWWGLPIALLGAAAYEWWEYRAGRTPGRFEIEDVRDVFLGALLGALAALVVGAQPVAAQGEDSAGSWRVLVTRMERGSSSPLEAGITWERLASLYGITFCRAGEPVSFIRAGLDPAEQAAAQAHEAMHQAQYRRAGGCDRFQRLYATPAGRLLAEAEAYHAGWCAAVRAGADSVALEQQYLRLLTLVSDTPPPQAAREAWARYRSQRCPEAR